MKPQAIEPVFSIDIIEKAKNYSLLAKNHTHRGIHIGDRIALAKILLYVPVDMIVATTGTSDRCMILVDYELGELMDLILDAKQSN